MHPDSLTDRINLTFAVREVGAASAQVIDRGTKRKAPDADDETSTTRRRTREFLTSQDQGEVATPKPPQPE